MPELPEVETIRRQLAYELINKTISRVLVRKALVVAGRKKRPFTRALEGRVIRDVLRRGKLLIVVLDEGVLLIHLRMTGWFKYGSSPEPAARAVFFFDDGSVLSYMDQRMLGKLSVAADYRQDAFYKKLGPEITHISDSSFSAVLKRRPRSPIKNVLLDQCGIAGIGNIYACEGLFRAGIGPTRKPESLSPVEKKNLLAALKKVISQAIKREGSSINTFKNIYGEYGSMKKSHKVYDREGERCFSCRTLIRRVALAGRGTYFCPQCQK